MKKYLFILIFLTGLIFLAGCGSDPIRIDKADFDPNKQIECQKEDRGQECPNTLQPVCGWSGKNVKCLVYPCADNYANSCKACNNRDVSGYTFGKCPLNEDLYLNKKEAKWIEISRKFVSEMGQYVNHNGHNLKVVGIGQEECVGCDFVEYEFFLDSADKKRINRAVVKVIIKNFEIIDNKYQQEAVNYD